MQLSFSFHLSDYLEKFFIEQELQLTNAYEQNNSSTLALNPQLSGDQLLAKRRLSSDLFLKPLPTIKRTKQLLNSTDNEQHDLIDNQQIQTSTSPNSVAKKADEDTK